MGMYPFLPVTRGLVRQQTRTSTPAQIPLLPDTDATVNGVTYQVGVDLTTGQRATLATGDWEFDYTPSINQPDATLRTLIHFDTGGGNGIYWDGGTTLVVGWNNVADVNIPGVTIDSGQTGHIRVNAPNGVVVLTGFKTGNGTYGPGGAASFGAGWTYVTVGAYYGNTSKALSVIDNIFKVT